jgi:4-amino-4-deoxy-L-arabinose transferase-like glycosyltransferase
MIKPRSPKIMSLGQGRFGWFVLGIFVLALMVRLLNIWEIYNSPFFSILLGDARSYDEWARQIAGGILVVRLIQAATGALSCVFIASAGRRFFSKGAGIAAGLIMALYAPAIFFDGLIGKSALDILFISLLIWLLSRLMTKPSRQLWIWTGIVMGCLALTRENALILIVPVFFWPLLSFRAFGKRRLVFAGLFVLGLCAVLLPVAVRNKIVGGEFHLTTSQFGPNFYYGNNEQANGIYKPFRYGRGHAMFERQDATELAEQKLGRKLTASEVSKYWTKQALTYITSHPIDWLILKARTLVLLLNATEIVDTEDQYTYADWSLPLRVTGYIFHFGLLCPLAVLGFMATWDKRRNLWLLYLLALIYGASIIAFYVYGRYRYPIVPFLILFASAGLLEIRTIPRTKSNLKLSGFIAVLILTAILCNWQIIPKDAMKAETYNNVGNELILLGNISEAISNYQRALDVREESASTHNNFAMALELQGNLNEAIQHYRRAIQLKADFFEAHNNLGRAMSSKLKGIIGRL